MTSRWCLFPVVLSMWFFPPATVLPFSHRSRSHCVSFFLSLCQAHQGHAHIVVPRLVMWYVTMQHRTVLTEKVQAALNHTERPGCLKANNGTTHLNTSNVDLRVKLKANCVHTKTQYLPHQLFKLCGKEKNNSLKKWHLRFSSVHSSSRWYLIARETPYALHPAHPSKDSH